MTIVAVTSARSSPGVTSLALGLAVAAQRREQEAFLIEADAAGGVLGLRFGLSASPSLATFSGDVRRNVTSSALFANSQEILGVPTLIAPVDPLDANRQINKTASDLSTLLPQLSNRFITIDLGRVTNDTQALALGEMADAVLIATDSSIEGLQSALYLQRLLRIRSCTVAITLVGPIIHEAPEISEVTDASILGHIPKAPKASAALRGGRFNKRQFTRSEYFRSIDSLYLALSDLPSVHRAVSEDGGAGDKEIDHTAVVDTDFQVNGVAPDDAQMPPQPAPNAIPVDVGPIPSAPTGTVPVVPVAPETAEAVATAPLTPDIVDSEGFVSAHLAQEYPDLPPTVFQPAEPDSHRAANDFMAPVVQPADLNGEGIAP